MIKEDQLEFEQFCDENGLTTHFENGEIARSKDAMLAWAGACALHNRAWKHVFDCVLEYAGGEDTVEIYKEAHKRIEASKRAQGPKKV